MLTYVRLGTMHYKRAPGPETPIHSRASWEFEACLTGSMKAWLPDPDSDEELRERTLWVSPGLHPHGWLSDAPCERAVFHFSTVPEELERFVPPRGYYRVALSPADCARIRSLARAAEEADRHPTELSRLQEAILKGELSMIALREITPRSLSGRRLARRKAEQALVWFAEHMAESPRFPDVCHAVHVSPAYLRRLFHQARDESPHDAFNRLRMEKAHELLQDPKLTLEIISEQVGLSSASALSRAIKAHFGFTPRQLRGGGANNRLTPPEGK